jgi:hypothetical protein
MICKKSVYIPISEHKLTSRCVCFF